MPSSLSRRVGIGGLVFIVLFIVSGSLVSQKSTTTPLNQIAAFYPQHRGALNAEAFLTGVAVLVGLAYYWYLRDVIATTAETRRLANLGYVGVLFFAMSGSLSAGLERTLSDVATHASPQTIQTLHVLSTEATDVSAGGGVALFLIATGVAVIRGDVLYTWLGWVGIVLGIASLVVPDASGVGAGIWTLVASIILLVRAPGSSPAVEPPESLAVSSA